MFLVDTNQNISNVYRQYISRIKLSQPKHNLHNIYMASVYPGEVTSTLGTRPTAELRVLWWLKLTTGVEVRQF